MSSPLYEEKEKEKTIMFEAILKTVLYVLTSWIVVRNLVVMIHNDNELQKKYKREGVRY